MKKFYVQSMIKRKNGFDLFETEVMAETEKEAIQKRKKRAPRQQIIGIRLPGGK